MSLRYKTDWILFATVLLMVSFGVIVLYSASSIMAKLDPRFGSSWHFVIRQIGWVVVAVAAMMTLKKTNYARFNHASVAFTAIGVVLCLLVLVYFVDTHHRWLRLGGPIGVQPSELAKPALVVFLAFFVTWRGRAINNPRHTLIPAALAVGLVIFAVVVPDLGTAAVLGATAMIVFFVAGLQWRYCFIVAGIAFLGLLVSIFAYPYRLARVVKFFDSDFKIVSKFDPQGRIKARMEETLR